MGRLLIISVILLSLILITIPTVTSEGLIDCLDCRRIIQVIPIGSTKTGEPIVTETPTNLTIFHTGKGPVKNVWLLIVLNEPTYNALNQITINDELFMTKKDFQLVTTKRIPPLLPNSTTEYPGSVCQYNTKAIKDKIRGNGNLIYYGMKFFLSQITKTPTSFKLAVELNSSANLKALILALGRCDFANQCDNKPFNACNSFSNSTLIVPEVATLALTSAPLCGAIGFYIIKQRKKQKQN